MNDLANGNGISKHDKLLFWGCFIALITTAFAFISRMFLIGVWGEQFSLDAQQQGALLGAGVWPFAISIILFSLFIDKIGYKFAMVFSFLAYLIWSIVGVAAFFVAKDGDEASIQTAYNMLYWGSILLGLANGTVEAYINPVVATMFSKEKTKWLNILHAGWPGGLVVAGLVTIALGDVPWWIKIGIIAVPAVVFFFMLIPLKFPENERVAAGVSYKAMLAEFGFSGAVLIGFLLVLQLIEALPMVPALVFIVGGTLAAIVFGLYTMSLGNPFVFIMSIIMMPLAVTEIGTDGWITGIMEGVFEDLHPGWILIYTSAIMMTLRFVAGPIVHALSPVGLLIVSAILAIVGLVTLSMTAGVMIFAAATLYAVGKTFFWPTMLGIVAEQSPKGGALTLNSLAGIGMLAVGVLGFPFIGVLQANHAIEDVQDNTAIVEAVPGLVEDGMLVATVDKEAYYGVLPYQDLDNAKIAELVAPLGEEKAAEITAQIAEVKGKSAQGALFDMAIFPGFMLLCYIIMFFYFKSKGGYQAQHLTTDEGLSPKAQELAAQAAQE